MKLPALALAVLASISVAYGSDADKAPADTSKVPRHSHMQEKTGMAPKPANATSDETKERAKAKPKPEKDRSRHFHPRDAK